MVLSARGRSTFIEWVSTGTVIMKMISNTSMTSTRGVMLISLITSLSSSRPPPKAISAHLFVVGFAVVESGYLCRLAAGWRRAGNKVGVQLVSKTVESAEDALVAATECVVTQNCRNGHGQSKCSHDQSFTHRACHLVDTGGTGNAYAHQRVIDTPYSAEQTYEGRCGSHGCEHRQTPLQTLGTFIDTAAQTG